MQVLQVTPNYIRKVIAEERQILLEHNSLKRMLIIEGDRLAREGHTPRQINEGLLDIVKSLGGGFIETFKYDITLSILGALGMNKEGFLARAVANVVENADIMDIKKYFAGGPAGCAELANLIMDSLIETGLEPLIDSFVKSLGVDPEGRLYASIRESIAKSFLDGDMAEAIQGKLSDWICNIDVSSIVDTVKGSLGFGGGSKAPEQLDLGSVAPGAGFGDFSSGGAGGLPDMSALLDQLKGMMK